MDRREFLACSAAAAAAAPGRRLQAPAAAPAPWYATMRRCGQLNFNERDPLTLDVGAWAEYWASLRVNALLVNGGGIMAFYPTDIPYHHRSAFLGTRDLFGEMAAAARTRGIRVVARMDCNYSWEEALQAHPEWFERDRDGQPRRHGESTWLFKTCMFSPYFTDQMPAIYREIAGRYAVDAFFTNGWPSTGALRDAGAHDHQRNRRLQQQPPGVAPRREARGRDDPVDGANGRERHGAVVSLAGWLARGPALAGHGARVLLLARRPRAALPQHALGGRPRGTVPAEHHRLLARLRQSPGHRLSAGAVRGAAAGALYVRLRAREW